MLYEILPWPCLVAPTACSIKLVLSEIKKVFSGIEPGNIACMVALNYIKRALNTHAQHRAFNTP